MNRRIVTSKIGEIITVALVFVIGISVVTTVASLTTLSQSASAHLVIYSA
jgi:hypothetical protein